ncbi:MAG: hypothetical protein ACYTFG_08105 [Planctomycetota bacterium]|jgi:hypothetical protein
MDDLFSHKIHWSVLVLVLATGFWAIPMCIPHSHSRIGSNEASAQGSLKSIATGQEQFKSVCNIDADKDGVGEYGFLSELGGTRKGRLDHAFSASPYIPRILGTMNGFGCVSKAGYFFKLYLPGKDGKAIREFANSVPPVGGELADLHEKTYRVIAWPQQKGKTGERAFAIDQRGEPFYLPSSPWSGAEDSPPWIPPNEFGEGTFSESREGLVRGNLIWVKSG